MSKAERLQAELTKVYSELDALTEVRKTEVKRRYSVLHATILSLHAVEKRQTEFLEAERKAAKLRQIRELIAVVAILYQLWMKTESNEVVTYIIVLGLVLISVGASIISDISSHAKSNQFWFEKNRLKTDLESLTSSSTQLTWDLITIQNKYDDENPNYEALSDKKIEWEIDALKALIIHV